MRLTSFWTQGAIYWRVFDAADTANAIGIGEGYLNSSGSSFGFSAGGPIKLELRRGDVFGPRIMSPRLVQDGDELVLEDNGQVHPFVERRLFVTRPAAGGQLTQARLGLPETVSATFDLGDLGRLVDVDAYLSDVRVVCLVAQAGQPTQEFGAQRNTATSPPQYAANLTLARPGAYRLTLEARSPSVVKRLSSAAVAVTVAAVQTVAPRVSIAGQVFGQGAQPVVNVSPAGVTSRIEVTPGPSIIDVVAKIGAGAGLRMTRAGALWSLDYPLPGSAAPGYPVLTITETDVFGGVTSTPLSFQARDVTGPTITLTNPAPGRPLVRAGPSEVLFSGVVSDDQSGFRSGSVRYTLDGASGVAADGAGGAFSFSLPNLAVGPYELRLQAQDVSGNLTESRFPFAIVASYAAASIAELLSPGRYLADLLRFVTTHLEVPAPVRRPTRPPTPRGPPTAVSATMLSDGFGQPFADLAQPGALHGDDPVCDLLGPLRVMRARQGARTAGLLARWTFAELADGAMDGLRDRFGRYRLNGAYRNAAGQAVLGRDAQALAGPVGGETEAALVLDGTNAAVLDGPAARAALEMGQDDGDFSVAFWVRPNDSGQPGGPWRSLLFKGSEANGAVVNRTFALFLYPDSNTVHFRISTQGQPNDGGDSRARIAAARWSHLAYVKAGRTLRLYINGVLDTEVALAGPVVPNTDPLYIGANPYFSGLPGAFAEVRLYSCALGAADVLSLAADRRIGRTETRAEATYHQAAYEAALRGAGVSYEELRTLRTMDAARRANLAQRMGVGDARGDQLGLYFPPPWAPGASEFEFWLAGMFGLPLTFTPPPGVQQPAGPPQLLTDRRAALTLSWLTNDQETTPWPDLDPDLVGLADLAPTAGEWRVLLGARKAEVARMVQSLTAPANDAAALALVVPVDEQRKLLELEAADTAGQSIDQPLAALSLSLVMFRRLVAYVRLITGFQAGERLSAAEREDLVHLLTQLWKVRARLPTWRAEEAALATRLWPTGAEDVAFVPGAAWPAFMPWRGGVAQRAALERRIAARRRAWQALSDDVARLSLDAQHAALPKFRDALLGMDDLPARGPRMDVLSERWLVDVATGGATTTSAIDQATQSAQTLVNGVRNRWYGAGHPAATWRIAADNEATFDDEWPWMGSYTRWRAAMMNYLYPENALYPELRRLQADPAAQTVDLGFSTAAYASFLTQLRKLRPVTPGTLAAPPADYTTALGALTGDEQSYFAPVSIGLALQRAGLHAAALDVYRQVYDTRLPTPTERKRVAWLRRENDNRPPAPAFVESWTLSLSSPHELAAPGRPAPMYGNPYTRFTLMQIVLCTLAVADDAFAAGLTDSRARALAAYLEAGDILGLEELRDLTPASPDQAFLPNPILAAYRARVDSALRKLRNGLTYLGTPMPPDPTRGASGAVLSSLVRPTPYRYRALQERAKQLAALAGQFEAQYLSAIERDEAEVEKLLREGFASEAAAQAVVIRTAGVTEALDGVVLAQQQQTRSRIEQARLDDWIAAGPNAYERAQLESVADTALIRQVINVAQTAASVASMAGSAAGSAVGSFGAASALFVAGGVAQATASIAQGFLIDAESKAQTAGMIASFERRDDEWRLRADLADQDIRISGQQIVLAQDRSVIARQELIAAQAQETQTRQMIAFLEGKFTSAAFYEWLASVLADTYAFFLRLATATARLAELQLAFERQQAPRQLIRADYWTAASAGYGGDIAKDTRGVTGSTRLTQDLYNLDEQAFSSEQRLLNLSQSFSLAERGPLEFETFRRTGVLSFATPMAWFDEGFPGHYMRLIKRVRVSIIALIPPTAGIRASLINNGLSRVVTADPGNPTTVIQQGPQIAVLTSPAAASGVFELDMQSELLLPFEGGGVDTSWVLELPPSGNAFDFGSLMDVVVSIDYTALFSPDVREKVVRTLPRTASGLRTFSVRRDFPDVWYALANDPATAAAEVALRLAPAQFPPALRDVAITELAVLARTLDGTACAFSVTPKVNRASGGRQGQTVSALAGLASSRQGAAADWAEMLPGALPSAGAVWTFTFANDPAAPSGAEFRQELRDGLVDDIIVSFTYEASKPIWSAQIGG